MNGEDLSCYSNETESVSLRKCPYYHRLTDKAYFLKHCHGDKQFSEFLPTRWRQKSTGIDLEQNYVTVTLCISIQFDLFSNKATNASRTSVDIGASAKLELVDEFCNLGDMLSVDGDADAAVEDVRYSGWV